MSVWQRQKSHFGLSCTVLTVLEGLEAECWVSDLWTHKGDMLSGGTGEAIYEWMIEYMNNNLLINQLMTWSISHSKDGAWAGVNELKSANVPQRQLISGLKWNKLCFPTWLGVPNTLTSGKHKGKKDYYRNPNSTNVKTFTVVKFGRVIYGLHLCRELSLHIHINELQLSVYDKYYTLLWTSLDSG